MYVHWLALPDMPDCGRKLTCAAHRAVQKNSTQLEEMHSKLVTMARLVKASQLFVQDTDTRLTTAVTALEQKANTAHDLLFGMGHTVHFC
jgi:hypothetical protein